ncbi:DUF4041 domain-containing protein [Falcatimonas sp. MSJ-15]|uniref:DUF4041 domain-containing protein n=1 Tax=Falcatimonas sp. MSJ-15 TaxID=2841515 RepID=UPI00209E4A83|nr:DUF4041 domain-containing protein [Falcatimonas sp. MSJ-15]
MNSNKKQKWYFNTWLIGMLYAFWFLYGIPLAIAVLLTVRKNMYEKKLFNIYGEMDDSKLALSRMHNDYELKKLELEKDFDTKFNILNSRYIEKSGEYNSEIQNLKKEISTLNAETYTDHYNYSSYDGLASEDCKNKLTMLKNKEKEIIKAEKAFIVTSDGSKKEIADNKKQILRCFNAECDNLLLGLGCKNIDTTRNKISKSFDSLNKIFAVDGISLSPEMLEIKLEELNLVYTYELKKEQERQQQNAIKEQMLEEEKVRREIERQKAKLEKDQTQTSNEIKKLMGYMQKTSSEVEKQLYVDKIKELESRIKELEKDKETVLEREANARAGYVYVISNIGSFGEDIYKIGMTRRLEPMDRIKELSSASVPFEFDVHAMIFSDNAPELETMLHHYFEKQSVNRVNLKKEFFHVTLDEIEKVVKENFNNTVVFTRIAKAEEYRQTLNILQSESMSA